MKVFISWSGEPSRSIAKELRHWLTLVVQHVQPRMSDEEIDSGSRWNEKIATELETTDFGIVCMTLANQHQPWLMFEAGALAKRLGKTARVVPLCIDIPPAEITGPLEAFQARCLDEDGMRRLVHDVSAVRETPLSADQVDALFDAMWPRLYEAVEQAKAQAPQVATTRRSAQDMLEEVVERLRRTDSSARIVPLRRIAPGSTVIVNGNQWAVDGPDDAVRVEELRDHLGLLPLPLTAVWGDSSALPPARGTTAAPIPTSTGGKFA